jgi:hypothetical protein
MELYLLVCCLNIPHWPFENGPPVSKEYTVWAFDVGLSVLSRLTSYNLSPTSFYLSDVKLLGILIYLIASVRTYH